MAVVNFFFIKNLIILSINVEKVVKLFIKFVVIICFKVVEIFMCFIVIFVIKYKIKLLIMFIKSVVKGKLLRFS